MNEFKKLSIYEWALALLVMTQPYNIRLNAILILVVAIAWLFSNSLTNKWAHLKKYWVPLAPFFAYILLQILGIWSSNNTSAASFVLEKKLSLIVVPVLLLTGPIISKTKVMLYQRLLSYSALAGSALLLVSSAYKYTQTGYDDTLYYHAFANSSFLTLHAIYFSLYVSMAVIYFLYSFSEGNRNHQIFHTISIAILLLTLVLLSSKTLFFGTILAVIYWFVKGLNYSFKKKLIGGSIVLILASGVLMIDSPIKKRYAEILDSNWSTINQNQFEYNTELNGLTLRLIFWKQGLYILKENGAVMLGIGTGDIQSILTDRYTEIGLYTDENSPNPVGYQTYNLHNQYMQELFASGILGLSIFIFLVLYFLIRNFKHNPYFFIYFVIFSIFCLTESAFERQKGVVLFALLASISVHKNETLVT